MEKPQQPSRPFPFARLILPLLWIAIGVILGFLIPKRSTENHTRTAAAIPNQATVPSTEKTLTKNTLGPPAPALSALERLRMACLNPRFGTVDLTEAIPAIQQLTSSELQPAVAVIREVIGDERRSLFDALAKRWAAYDANDALAAALRERRDHSWRDRLGPAAGEVLAAADPNGAFERIGAARRGEQRRLLALWILPSIARIDPARAAEFLLTDKSLENDGDVVYWVAREFGKLSPQEALAWADKLPGLRPRQHAKKSAFAGWAEADPAAGAAALKNATGLDADTFETVGFIWSRTDPEAAVTWAQSLTDKAPRERALRSIQLDVDKLGPDKARSLVESITDERARSEYAGRIAAQLAKSGDASEALAWAQSLTAPEARTHAITQAVQEWSSIDPAAAVRYAAEMPEGKTRTDLFAQAFAHWARNEPDEAFAYGQQLPPGKDRDAATARAINAMRDNDPQKALQWFEQIEDPKIAQQVAQGLLGSLVRVDQDAAFRVASALPPETQPEAYHGLVRNWAFDYPQEAGNWVNSLPPGPARDSAVKAYVSVIDGMDAGTATQWAYSIQDPTIRVETTMDAFQRWLRTDHSAAAAWLETAEFPDGLRPFFEREVKNRQNQSFE